MKKNAIFTVCLLCVYVCNAQSTSYTNLGILCYINVSLSHDPVDNQGYLTYTINTPDETACGIQGPGSPILTNNLGSTVDLKIRRIHLDLAADGLNCEIPLELTVAKWSTGWGHYTTSPSSGGAQCYYYIVLLIEQ